MLVKEKFIINADYRAFYEALLFVEECVKEGYSVPSVEDSENFPRHLGMGRFLIRMVKDAEESDVVAVRKELLEQLTRKVDLLEFAEKEGIEIPEDVKIPTAIQKYIKEQMEEKENA